MELWGTITGYLLAGMLAMLIITGCVAWIIYMIYDALGVKRLFLQIKRERDAARKELRELKNV